jgi:hypothetical protein
MINQTKLFGTNEKVFTLVKLSKFLHEEDAYTNDFIKSKKYFLKYFAKSLDDHCYKYEPNEFDDDGQIHKIHSLKSVFDQIPTIEYKIGDSDKKRRFDLRQWFMKSHYATYEIGGDPREKRFFSSQKTGRNYINLCKGFMHKERVEYASFSNEVKANVNKLIDHIHSVWNSDNKASSEYTMKWLAHACTGHKMKTCLFLKSGEGTGKSINIEFILQHVIGPALGIITQRANQLAKFNFQLLNKILLCLEELPSGGKSEWHSISDYLKDIITGGSMEIERKFEDAYQIANIISLIIITNNENSLRFGKDIRRYHMCDISHDKVGDTQYFNDLYDALDRETGTAFFWYLTELYENNKDFNEAVLPDTNAKLAMKEQNITPVLQYIKEDFLVHGKGLDDNGNPYQLQKFIDELNGTKNKQYKIRNFSNMLLADISIIKIKPRTQKSLLYIMPISHDDLLAYYKKKGFWDDQYDKKMDIVNGATDDDLDEGTSMPDLTPDEEIASITEQMRVLNERLNKLKKDLIKNDPIEPVEPAKRTKKYTKKPIKKDTKSAPDNDTVIESNLVLNLAMV